MLVIADTAKPIAIAGVMGGADSEVSGRTTRIAIESAWFDPASVRATSKRFGLKTEASTRFERGADIGAPVRAIARVLQLLETLGVGRAVGEINDVYPDPSAARRITLKPHHLSRLLGDHVPADAVERILRKLGFGVAGVGEDWAVEVPSFRVDVYREADLIEEVGRHWGFDRIPPRFPTLRSEPHPVGPNISRARMIRRLLCGAGLQEAVTFTCVEQAAAVPFVPEPGALVEIANPLSEKFAVLRPSLLPGLLDALIYNCRRQAASVRLFELGSVFGRDAERHFVGWMLTGPREDHWSAKTGAADFFDAKGIAELLAEACKVTLRAELSDESPWFQPGRGAKLLAETVAGHAAVGSIGQLRPDLVEARGLTHATPVVAGEIDLVILSGCSVTGARPIDPLPRHPAVIRDLSIVVIDRLPAAAVRATIRASAPPTLVDVREFDRYQGKGVSAGHVSLSVRLTFRDPDRTLTDSEVQSAVDAIVAALARDHGASLRGSAGPHPE
jgi:phenylalanyl-tRNA synthetase beta chain